MPLKISEKMTTDSLIKIDYPSAQWKEYRLIDCGNKCKLEQFGQYILIRPEPQAIWQPKLEMKDWYRMAHAEFVRKPDFRQNPAKENELEGGWKILKKMPEIWTMQYVSSSVSLKINLRMTGFGHIGIFPEQSSNWEFLLQHVQKGQKVLNLFAYTGIASLAAAKAGALVTHIDSVKNVVNWGRENAESNHLDNIRWIVEDAFKFVQREQSRGNQYDCIVLDPPAYGRGPKGEKWILEEKLAELLQMVKTILKPDGKLIINLYSLGYSPLLCYNLLLSLFPKNKIETGDLCIKSEHGHYLPLSVFGRLG
ncbi:MAG: class I SAM-dependent methyltransferase [Bacteroidetes bacterium]|nr:class I SAM-dependent methyltransferase [Bacteroidota bacterium]